MKTLSRSLPVLALLGLLLGSGRLHAQNWVADPVHSNVIFMVRHIVTPFVGEFTAYEVSLQLDQDLPEESWVKATVDPGSVSTGVEGRDKHLRSADFFDVENHNSWSFRSTSMEKTGEDTWLATGLLSARGTEKEVQIPFTWLGEEELEYEDKKYTKAGLSAEFTVLRSDFNLGKAGASLGDKVTVKVFLELDGQ